MARATHAFKRGAHPRRRESAPGRRRDGGLSALLDGERRVSTSVGVVDHGVEGLIDPLPEHHGRRRPGTERPVRRPPSPATAPRGRAENASTGRGQRGGGRPGGWAGSCRPCFPVTSFGSHGQRHARKVTARVELTNLNLILNVYRAWHRVDNRCQVPPPGGKGSRLQAEYSWSLLTSCAT